MIPILGPFLGGSEALRATIPLLQFFDTLAPKLCMQLREPRLPSRDHKTGASPLKKIGASVKRDPGDVSGVTLADVGY